MKKIIDNPETKEKIGEIEILSNGTIVPDSTTLELIKNNYITVVISNYLEKSKNMAKMVDVFLERGILFSIVHLNGWSDSMQLQKDAIQLDDSKLLEYRKACKTTCRSVAEGKFYMCSLSYSMEKLQAVPFDERNYVDLYADKLKDRLYEYLRRDRPMPPSCSWCSCCTTANWEKRGLVVAEQVKQPIPYKKYV